MLLGIFAGFCLTRFSWRDPHVYRLGISNYSLEDVGCQLPFVTFYSIAGDFNPVFMDWVFQICEVILHKPPMWEYKNIFGVQHASPLFV